MKVRLSGTALYCECLVALEFMDRIDEAPQRRMRCMNPSCQHFGRIVLEPIFHLKDAPLKPDDDTQEFIPVKPDLAALRDAAQGDGAKDASFAVSRRR